MPPSFPLISGGLEYLFDKQKMLTLEFPEEEVTIKQVFFVIFARFAYLLVSLPAGSSCGFASDCYLTIASFFSSSSSFGHLHFTRRWTVTGRILTDSRAHEGRASEGEARIVHAGRDSVRLIHHGCVSPRFQHSNSMWYRFSCIIQTPRYSRFDQRH